MGRRRRSSRSSRGFNKSFAAATVASGKVFWQLSASTTASFFALHPSNVPRLVDLANAFQSYRFTKLKVEVLPSFRSQTSVPSSPQMYYVGYYNDTVDTLPNSTQAGSELAYSVVRPMGYMIDTANSSAISVLSVPSEFKVPRKFLLKDSSLKWYKANLGTPDSWDEIQGNIVFRAENTIEIHIMLWYTCEFVGPLPFISTPEGFAERLEQSRRHRMLLDLYQEYMSGKIKLPEGTQRVFENLVLAKSKILPLSVQ